MNVVLLAPANSIHTHRWVDALHARGLQLTLVSQHDPEDWRAPGNVSFLKLPYSGTSGYFMNVPTLRRILGELRPDLLNAHYASGYGTTAAFSGFAPSLLSVWGSDVFDFPFESRVKGALVRFNLRRASRIASTSRVMAQQVRALEPALLPAFVTPFGVDCERFRPIATRDSQAITVGTVKTLASKYGIDLLIHAFALLQADQQLSDAAIGFRLRLLIVGGGEERDALRSLADRVCVAGTVTFAGAVAHADVPQWLNRFDVYVAASRLDSESFGVAVIEASACGLPVVVSDAGGLPEVVQHGRTGFVVPRENVEALAASMRVLVMDETLRQTMGYAGRQFVLADYEWEHSVDTMLAAYRTVVADAGGARPPRTARLDQ